MYFSYPQCVPNILKKDIMGLLIGFIWRRIDSSSGVLWTWWQTSVFH